MAIAATAPGASRPKTRTRHYGLRKDLRLLHTLLLSGGLAGLFLSMAWSLYNAFFAYQTFGPAIVPRWASRPLPFAFAGLAITAYSGLWLLRRRGLRVSLHPSGFRISTRGRNLQARWDEVERIWLTSIRYGLTAQPSRQHASMRLETTAGETIHLDHTLEGFLELVQCVKEHAYPHILDRYRQQLRRGESLDFGPLRLSGEAIRLGSRSFAWSQLSDVSIRKGRLELLFQEEGQILRRRVTLGRVPNADICHQLLKNMEF